MIIGGFLPFGKMATIKGMHGLMRKLSQLPKRIDETIEQTLLEYARKILNEAISNLPPGAASIGSTYHIEVLENGKAVAIYTDNEIAAYIEFGTGNPETVREGLSAKEYLATQPQEVVAEALKFFVTGEGTMPAQPYLFPAFYKYRDEIAVKLKERLKRVTTW